MCAYLKYHADNTRNNSKTSHFYYTVVHKRGSEMQVNTMTNVASFLSLAVDHVKFGPPMRKVTDPCPDLVRMNV